MSDQRLEITVIGRRAGMPDAGEPSSGYLVRCGDTRVLLDCGPGVAGAVRGHVDPAELDAVVLSHLHLDHCYDIIPLGKTLLGPRPSQPLHRPVSGRPLLSIPRGATDTLRALNRLLPVGGGERALDRVVDEAFETVEHEPDAEFRIGGFRVRLGPTNHAIACTAIRLDSASGSVVYSADTGWSDEVAELAGGADLFICESTLVTPDESGHGHLSAREAGELAATAGVGGLLLTHLAATDPAHIDALLNQAAAAFDGPIRVAEPGVVVPVARTLPSRKEPST